jgi:hypothetical protein
MAQYGKYLHRLLQSAARHLWHNQEQNPATLTNAQTSQTTWTVTKVSSMTNEGLQNW